jgi:hypothetical protein
MEKTHPDEVFPYYRDNFAISYTLEKYCNLYLCNIDDLESSQTSVIGKCKIIRFLVKTQLIPPSSRARSDQISFPSLR